MIVLVEENILVLRKWNGLMISQVAAANVNK